jgi:2-phosphosulfolactate phosphatase
LCNGWAIAQHIQRYQTGISIIPAGEQWADGSLRPALEDWIGAGAILSGLEGTRSPEVEAAIASFRSVQHDLESALQQCSSGKELTGRGFAEDVALAAAINQSQYVPHLIDKAYSRFVA